MAQGNRPVPRLAERRAAAAAQPPSQVQRGILLWLFSAPLLPSALIALTAARLDGFLADAAAWGLVATGAVLTRRGSLRPAEAPRFSRRWRLPLKNLAAVAVAAGTALAATVGVGYAWPIGIAFGLVALLGYHLTYGLEPMRIGRELPGLDGESRAVAEALADAEERLLRIRKAASAIANRELSARLGRIADLGNGILEQIAARPSDLRRARRFLSVFLEGAEQVSDGYARTHPYADSAELEQHFRDVLVTIEDRFELQQQRLRDADVLDLDVQIEVLKKQLKYDG